MKIIRYKFLSCEVNHGTEEEPNIEQVVLPKQLPYSEEALEIARRESYNGEEPEIFDDGKPDPETAPTQLDRVEAQVTYTAMMTDTLLEG